MKNDSSVFRMAFAVATASSLCVGAPLGLHGDQDTVTAPGSVADPPARTAQAPPIVSEAVGEVVRMYQGGADKEVVLCYISNAEISCHLNADAVLYFKALGMPPEVAKAMIQRDAELRREQQACRPQQPMLAPGGFFPGQPPPPFMTSESPPQDNPDNPDYNAGYPGSFYGIPYAFWAGNAGFDGRKGGRWTTPSAGCSPGNVPFCERSPVFTPVLPSAPPPPQPPRLPFPAQPVFHVGRK